VPALLLPPLFSAVALQPLGTYGCLAGLVGGFRWRSMPYGESAGRTVNCSRPLHWRWNWSRSGFVVEVGLMALHFGRGAGALKRCSYLQPDSNSHWRRWSARPNPPYCLPGSTAFPLAEKAQRPIPVGRWKGGSVATCWCGRRSYLDLDRHRLGKAARN